MSDVERIIQKGIVGKDFFKSEIKCGFNITVERKKLFAILLDMLYEFDKVCKKYGLTYFFMYGSLIGAVRHHGFIPWDDDLDVAMPREDYEKFIKLSDEFKEPLFLQTPYTDPEYFYTPARIRNSNTTAVVEMFRYAGFNQGIWFSIFPLDRWDDNGGEERYAEIRKLVMHNSTYMRVKNPDLDEKNKARVAAYLAEHRDPLKDYEEIQRLASSCKDPDSKHCIVAVITQTQYNKKLFDAEDFAKTVPLNFEGLEIMAPSGYDHLLRTTYGDYMQLPPVEERGMWHDGTIFDADIPYSEYLRQKGVIK